METSQFTSSFWHYYICAIVILSFIGLFWLLFSQNKVKAPPKGEDVKTMGHEWDGIEEYNNPLPRWWFFLFILTVLFSIGYLIVYPGMGDFKGVGFGGQAWTSQSQYESEVKAANEKFAPVYAKFANMPVEEVAKDADAQRIGKHLFDTYCIQCHGSDAKGQRGFPDLTDHDWLWGGSPDQIKESIAKGRVGIMAAWGPQLGEEGVKNAAHYVLSLSNPGNPNLDPGRVKRGEAVFHGPPANCFVCHGDKGQGVLGAGPNLSDDVWLWGNSEKAIMETITNGRHNQMPAWEGFLNDDKVHILTAYVWGKSNNGQAAAAADAKPSSAPAASEAAASQAAPAAASQAQPAADEAQVSFDKGMAVFYFATGKSEVAANAAQVAAELVEAGKAGKKLVISGYTDSTGNAALNAELSKQRAQVVKAFLEAQGVDPKNIELRKPEDTTAAQGNNAEGRRVEVSIEG
ncbi:cytochrome-c oxidase, cbb3-type subunit III [Neisseria shayeganii]|uniref:Cytochrome c oxidase subunit III n=1 Tax=Neisseria shayeganii 871 TaxID=1032488 RepID=G4CKM4_9NEIS|nr:cb-type cytochrome c oxidase subunit III [Neisseria shayeganii 871]